MVLETAEHAISCASRTSNPGGQPNPCTCRVKASGQDESHKQLRLSVSTPGSYVLKKVLEDIPLHSDGEQRQVSITCVEYWDVNLYIGTSASEIIHLVGLPAENESDPPTFILASRLRPVGDGARSPTGLSPGVQKILILPSSSKACVLCNGVLSFYSLPELSPAYPGTKLQSGVYWIGGMDANANTDSKEAEAIMIAYSRRMLLIHIGDRLQRIKAVDFPACLQASRRDTIACVADESNYALLEIEQQQKITLSSISSAQQEEEVVTAPSAPRLDVPSGHGRSKSMGNFPTASQDESPSRADTQSLAPSDTEQRPKSPAPAGDEGTRTSSRPRSSTDVTAAQTSGLAKKSSLKLIPHVLSPSPDEFMFTTGTAKDEPGVGVFVNLDGDVTRGTVEFDRYPESLLVHNFADEDDEPPPAGKGKQLVLALLDKTNVPDGGRGIEIQELTEPGTTKEWLRFPLADPNEGCGGLHRCLSIHRHTFAEVASLLQLVRYRPLLPQLFVEPDPRTRASIERLEQESALFDNQSPRAVSPTAEYEQRRNADEKLFVARLGHTATRAVVWSGSNLWQILPNPLLLQLEHRLLQSGVFKNDVYTFGSLNVSHLLSMLGSIREREYQDETEYLTLNYIRQKGSIILFLYLQKLLKTAKDVETTCQMVTSALEDGQIDPRVVLLLIPPLAREAIQGPNGIWLPQGIVDVLMSFKSEIRTFEDGPVVFWNVIRQYLTIWQGKRGYGSITDEKFVLDSVDAALLHVLLYLDQTLPQGFGMQSAVRTELNGIVDHWKGDFQRAIVLLEHYRRFFVLSRLYQSRKLAKDVLATWKRIAEGEEDADKSLTIDFVESRFRRYLTVISNTGLVQEYGLWLAKRNPTLAIQAFADDESTVKLTPAQVVSMLKMGAPGAVQQYLEHLVFSKNLDQYADDLIGYYLDSVLNVLETSEEAKASLEQSYATYRALTAPKPTYLDFITQNAPEQSWWQSRLRLLQLLGSGGYAKADLPHNELSYSVDKVLERLTPFSSYLVSESIILDARQGRYKEALRLLTHGLGDYDTAVRYCYFGGPTPTSSQPIDASLLPPREAQQDLFTFLFHEFLRIEDLEERIERTSHLLGTFASWFDPLTIFDHIPDHWTVDVISEFLLRSLRAARSERNQAIIVKALSASQNLRKQAEYIDVCEKFGLQIDAGTVDGPHSQDLASAIS